MESKVWLITGASSGFGLELTRTALAKGHQVIASSRNPAKTPELVEEIKKKGGTCITLDVSGDNVSKVLSEAWDIYGHIDVLVNNAGFSIHGAFEDLGRYPTEADIRTQYETNVFGVFKTMQAVLPRMRQRKSGTIVNISSTGGLRALPGVSLYAGSKHALEGMTESLAAEYAEHGIRLILVEPGPFRTNFLGNDASQARPLSDAFRGTAVAKVLKHLEESNGKQPGDPKKAAQAIFDFCMGQGKAAELKKPYLRLLLGNPAVKSANDKLDSLRENFNAVESISRSVDFED